MQKEVKLQYDTQAQSVKISSLSTICTTTGKCHASQWKTDIN